MKMVRELTEEEIEAVGKQCKTWLSPEELVLFARALFEAAEVKQGRVPTCFNCDMPLPDGCCGAFKNQPECSLFKK